MTYRGKRDVNKLDAEPLKLILEKTGVDVVVTDTSVDFDFRAANGSKHSEGSSTSDVDSGMNKSDRQHDGICIILLLLLVFFMSLVSKR
uniref:Uncharacterized protein n=1 Tax=Tanacetum cinerariifolium TaxID=118510 RepID=A0A699GJQ2_TANCI|nr:hypothetical protein [Tanacetum cinerariifolium]